MASDAGPIGSDAGADFAAFDSAQETSSSGRPPVSRHPGLSHQNSSRSLVSEANAADEAAFGTFEASFGDFEAEPAANLDSRLESGPESGVYDPVSLTVSLARPEAPASESEMSAPRTWWRWRRGVGRPGGQSTGHPTAQRRRRRRTQAVRAGLRSTQRDEARPIRAIPSTRGLQVRANALSRKADLMRNWRGNMGWFPGSAGTRSTRGSRPACEPGTPRRVSVRSPRPRCRVPK